MECTQHPPSIAARTLFNSLLYFRCFKIRTPGSVRVPNFRLPVPRYRLRRSGPALPHSFRQRASGTGPVILPFAGRKELQRYSAPVNTVQIYKKSAERQTAAPPNCQQSARRSFSRTPAGNNPARIAHGTSMNRPGLILRSSRGYGTTAGASPATPDLSRL